MSELEHQNLLFCFHNQEKLEGLEHLLLLQYDKNQTLIKQGEQIFIPDNVPHAPYNLSDKKCVWVVVHSSGDDQDELVRTTELDYILENF